MENSNLPEKPNWFRNLFGKGKKELERHIAYLDNKNNNLEEALKRAKSENEQLNDRIKELSDPATRIRSAQAKANQDVRTAQQEARKANEEAFAAKQEARKANEEAFAAKQELNRVKKLYADENGIDGQEKQVDRDSGVNAMLEKLQELQSQISKFQNSELKKTEKDERQINEMQKTLYARLFGIVSAYRDTLPPNEVPIHPVGDKTIDKFCTMLGDEIFKKMGTNREDYQINRKYKTQNMDQNIAGNINFYYINALRAMCGSDDFDRVLKKRATNDIDLYDVLADQLLNDINFIDGPKIPPTDFGIKSVGVAAKGVEEIIAKDEGR